ncbi:MAG TPA: ABC-2 family transporter protein [Armatimonadota bacterium]|jgi:ABC-2 type transport system permease protein
MDLLWTLRNPRMSVVYYLSSLLVNVAEVVGLLLLAERFQGIGAWSRGHVLFLLGYALTVAGLLGATFDYNTLEVSRRLGRGQLDHTLLQPRPLWTALLSEGCAPFSGSAALLPGLCLLAWSADALRLALSPAWLAALAANLAGSCGVILATCYLWGSLAFWQPVAAEEISASSRSLLHQLKAFPLDGLAPAARAGLLTALPVGFVAWYPCRVLLGLGSGHLWLTPAAASLLLLLSNRLFAKGLHHYLEVGSQRYTPFGHRR